MKKKTFLTFVSLVVVILISFVSYHRASAKLLNIFAEKFHSRLLFNFVTAIEGFDTGIVISNTSLDPFGTAPQSGTCTLYFYSGGSLLYQYTYTTQTIPAGGQWTDTTSDIAEGFNGYVIADCNFKCAHGMAYISRMGNGSCYPAEVLTLPRPVHESTGE